MGRGVQWWMVFGGWRQGKWDIIQLFDHAQDGQEMKLFITGESDCGDYLSERNHRDPGTSSGQSGKTVKKSVCLECPSKKPSQFFSSVSNGEGTEMAEPGGDFLSATLKPRESTIFGCGSRHRFSTRKDAGRSIETTTVHSLLSVLAPDRDAPRRWYGKCENGPKSPKDQKPDCPASKKTPPCTPKPKTCPPSKVKFRECPPPPKLPKLPKCPPPCAPPPPPPLPECPVPPKCPPPCAPPQNSPNGQNSPPCSPPKRKCSGRKMSTYGFFHRDCKCLSADETVASRLFRQRFPVLLVTRRRISSSSWNFASKGKSGKKTDNGGSKNCKKSKETKKNCSSKKSTTDGHPNWKESDKDCHVRPKNPATDCLARSKNRVTKKSAKDCNKPKSGAKCSETCAPRPRCAPLPPPPRSTTKVEWTPPICPPPRLVKPPPCPGKSKKACPGQLETLKPPCPPPPPLPKPPCRPVCLCPCPPPPKIPPGSCPDVPAVEEPNPSCPPPPCPPKVQTPCPKDDWCPSKPICPPKK